VWPPGSADTVCSRPPDTGIAFCFPNEEEAGRDETYIRVRRSLDTYSIKTLDNAFVMLRVDYCNAVYAVSPRYNTDISMKISNAQQSPADDGVYCQCQCISEHISSPIVDNFRLYLKAARTNYEFKHR